MSSVAVTDPRDDADIEQFAAVDAESFGESREQALRWLVAARGRAALRLARADGAVVGGYALLPAGQYFGGRSVPAQCVAAVAVHPAARRRGVAGALMRDLVAVAREHGAALAPLHAATTRLYRRWGWEVGGSGVIQTVQTRALTSLSGAGSLVRKPDLASVERLRRSVLPRWDGPLDRPDWWLALEWELGEPADQKLSYGWLEDGVLTGFVRYVQSREGGPWMTVDVRELITSTGNALNGLLGLLGSHDAQAPEVMFRHSSLRPQSDLLYLIPDADKVMSLRGSLCWMQRIVDLPEAVRARGWSAHATAAIELAVSDPVRDGAERLVLHVAGGRGEIAPGGAGHIQCGIGALSAWYAGTLRALDAWRLGLFHGGADHLAAMDALIGDRDPWMPDYF
jgi:predicted acetyltransferase